MQQPENPFSSLVANQEIAIIPTFTLESGVTLRNVPVAYTTRGQLAPNGRNAMVICHALSGSADVASWWGPLLGNGDRALDESRFFIICLNSLGSPYGTASPVTNIDNDSSKGRYGPNFPLTTIRDDMRLHKQVLDDLGVKQIAAVIGGSMGGMLTLEYAFLGSEYVRAIVPIATSSRHSAWGISWGEAQRQSIYCDPKYDDGYYSFSDPPTSGLGAARMQALLTYRSRDSFESRFGRNLPDTTQNSSTIESRPRAAPRDEHFVIHNDGHRSIGTPRAAASNSIKSPQGTSQSKESTGGPPAASEITQGSISAALKATDPQFYGAVPMTTTEGHVSQNPTFRSTNTQFSAQSYLRYQGTKFVNRFDSNCYIAITRKLDTHDVSRGRVAEADPSPTATALHQIKQPVLVLGIESDGLFTFAEQQEIAANIPHSRLERIDSMEGHDAFLLQFEQVNMYIRDFLRKTLSDMYQDQMNAGIMSSPVQRMAAAIQEDGTTRGGSQLSEVDELTAW